MRITRNKSSEFSDYWAKADEAVKVVASWPEWKRSVIIGAPLVEEDAHEQSR